MLNKKIRKMYVKTQNSWRCAPYITQFGIYLFSYNILQKKEMREWSDEGGKMEKERGFSAEKSFCALSSNKTPFRWLQVEDNFFTTLTVWSESRPKTGQFGDVNTLIIFLFFLFY